MMKRALDLTLAACGLLAASPLLLIAAIAIKLDSPGPVLFCQQRVGRRFRPFAIYKLRTMRADSQGRDISIGGDPRITRVGRLLRRLKIDELPQLVNVVKGDMSLVGPRPELPRFVERFHDEYAEILTARPGLTDPASIKYRDEAALLARAADPDAEYVERVLPDKLRLAREYVRTASVATDLALIARTLFSLASPRRQPAGPGRPPQTVR